MVSFFRHIFLKAILRALYSTKESASSGIPVLDWNSFHHFLVPSISDFEKDIMRSKYLSYALWIFVYLKPPMWTLFLFILC